MPLYSAYIYTSICIAASSILIHPNIYDPLGDARGRLQTVYTSGFTFVLHIRNTKLKTQQLTPGVHYMGQEGLEEHVPSGGSRGTRGTCTQWRVKRDWRNMYPVEGQEVLEEHVPSGGSSGTRGTCTQWRVKRYWRNMTSLTLDALSTTSPVPTSREPPPQ